MTCPGDEKESSNDQQKTGSASDSQKITDSRLKEWLDSRKLKALSREEDRSADNQYKTMIPKSRDNQE